MRTHIYIVLAALLALPLLTKAQDIAISHLRYNAHTCAREGYIGTQTDIQNAVIHAISIFDEPTTLTMDSVVVAEDSVPEWYVPAEIPAELRAPMRANAGTCLTDSILTFNADSVLTETTIYEYDAANRAIRTIVWKYDVTGGILSTSSKTEYAFDAAGTQIYTGTFAWDTNTNDWRGTAKSEFVYNEAHKMESNITYTWVNNSWLPSQALTYAYDAAGRETEFTTYSRNASVNHLVPSKQRLQTWYNASKKTLEINYTAYSNGAWSAGNKKEYAYDANGNQIEYTYYSSYSAGNWVGSTQEFWIYNASNKKTYYEKKTWSNGAWANSQKEIWEFNASNKQTLHEKYSGSGTDWTVTLREISGYDAAGNNTLVENYTYTNGVAKGTKKEEYTFNAAKKKINTYKYKWVAADNAWVYNTWAVTDFDAAGNATETANYNWKNNGWVGSGTRTLKTYNSSKKVTEQITQNWPSGATDWVNATRNTTTYQGAKTTQEASYTWQNEAWVGTTRSDWHYNAAGQNDTIKTYTNNGTDWIYSNRTVNTYNASGANIMTHNSSWNGMAWQLVSMTRTDELKDNAGRQLLYATWRCEGDSIWIGIQKDTAVYSASGLILYSAHYESWANSNWVPSYKIEYLYDEFGNVILNQRLDWIQNGWKGNYKYEYEYDTNGRQVMAANYTNWNPTLGDWVGSSKSEMTYNSLGQIVSKITYDWRNNTWYASNNYIFEYDDSNHEVEQIVQSYSNEVWINVLRFEKSYKGSMLIRSNEYEWKNNSWQIKLLSEKVYDNDSQTKLRREITGIWNNSGEVTSFKDILYFYSCDAPASNGSQPRTPTDIQNATIHAISIFDEPTTSTLDFEQPFYNLSGQRVDPATYHGIVIHAGHTHFLP